MTPISTVAISELQERIRVMLISEYANKVLFGENLEDKLLSFEELVCDQYRSLKDVPESPGRPLELRFDCKKSQQLSERRPEKGITFPSTPDKLHSDRSRGLVLHFFANHELLAMELMALCILKFPDSPPDFRKSLAQTMLEERSHLLLYRERMSVLGVDLGEFPVNRFFWNVLADMKSPMEFVTAMSLTFEQANLDFARHYLDLFTSLQDEDSAAVMQRVYEEEIGHVKNGLHWFRRWKEPGKSDWQEYCQNLIFPMTPRRGRGLDFDREARQKAGLDEEFIDNMEVYSETRGRPSDIYLFNPEVEEQVGAPDASPNDITRMFVDDFGSVMNFLATADDIVLCSRSPGRQVLKEWQEVGFDLAHFVETDGSTKDVREKLTKYRHLGQFRPWGWNDKVVATHSWRREQNHGSPVLSKSRGLEFRSALEGLLSNLINPAIESLSKMCNSMEEVLTCLDGIFEQTEWAVIKSEWAASGRGMKRIRRSDLDNENVTGWLKNQIKAGPLLVEAWVDRLVDLSVQIEVAPDRVKYHGFSIMDCDHRGRIDGFVLGRKKQFLPSASLKKLGQSGGVESVLKGIGVTVGHQLQEDHWFGPAGIDLFLYEYENQIYLRSVSEVNGRFTMGRVALALEKRLATGVDARWLLVNRGDLPDLGFTEFTELAYSVRDAFRNKSFDKNGRLYSGCFFTNDPDQARVGLGVVIVGDEVPHWLSRKSTDAK